MVLTESTQEEEVLLFLKKLIKGTEWENKLLLVGGAVRDEIMGKKPKDLDFVVNGDINAGINFSVWLGQKLGNFKQDSNPVIYPRYGTSKLSLNYNKYKLPNIDLEFVAPRQETYTTGSRKPNVINGDLMDETLRRDLTINSLMKNVSTDEILDLSGKGVNDIKNGIIRTTSNPDIIFKEDPLRMLRAIRFAVKYGFKMEPEVLNGIKKHANSISDISRERVTDELNKILLTVNPEKGMQLLKDLHLLRYVIEEFNDAIGMTQNEFHDEDVFNHTLTVLKNTPPELKSRLIALFHDIGKTLTRTVDAEGKVHFYGHEEVSERLVRQIMTRLKYPNELIDAVAAGVRNHMYLKHGEDDSSKLSDKTLRKFVASVGDNLEYVLDVIHADNISHAGETAMKNQINAVRERLKTLNMNVRKENMKLPINGNDLIQMGFKPSPLIGEILAAVQDAWYENPNMTREDALEIVDKIKLNNNINEIKTLMNKLINE